MKEGSKSYNFSFSTKYNINLISILILILNILSNMILYISFRVWNKLVLKLLFKNYIIFGITFWKPNDSEEYTCLFYACKLYQILVFATILFSIISTWLLNHRISFSYGFIYVLLRSIVHWKQCESRGDCSIYVLFRPVIHWK